MTRQKKVQTRQFLDALDQSAALTYSADLAWGEQVTQDAVEVHPCIRGRYEVHSKVALGVSLHVHHVHIL